MSLNEMFDVFNEQLIKIGEETRQNVHAQGLWHQTFHCWIIHTSIKGDLELLLQLRHKDKDTYPDLLDISCAGHLQAGETVIDGVRELQEELGMSVPFEDLVYCGMIAEENVISSSLIDREFNHVFVYTCNKPLIEYTIQASEISGLFFIKLNDFKKLINGVIEYIVVEGLLFNEMEEKMIHNTRKIYKSDFTPNSKQYYNMLFEKIEIKFL
jgi:isopentenyldiphosphate isomerase